jgi:hypothetical protein
MSKGSSGKGSGKGGTPMSGQAAGRVQSAAARHPDSPSAESGFDRRAQSAADRNAGAPQDQDDEDDE